MDTMRGGPRGESVPEDRAGPPAPRPRLSLDDLAASPPDELPDVGREIRTLRRILELNKRLARADDEGALLDEVLDAANAMMGSERASLVAAGAGGVPGEIRARDLAGAAATGAACASVARAALERRTPVVSGHLARDPRHPDADPGDRSVLCVPVPGPEPRALYLASRREEDLFTSADGDLVQLLAEQTAVALERVRLLALSRRQQEELLSAARNAEALNRRLADALAQRTAELREAREDLVAAAGEDDAFRLRFPEIVGAGPAMLATLRQVDRVAGADVPVLVEGESGTGKELLARALHAASRRSGARFVAENCAALPESLLENELFGHERGAFTGADAAAPGLFERADGGTLFLDEVGDMSAGLQKRLLRVLQEGEVRRVGGSAVRRVDVRIVTATNRDLAALVRDGRFREDLYYRLAVIRIRVPPLRERKEDIPSLARHFLGKLRGTDRPLRVTERAMDCLVSCRWPGNVRQLENEMRRAAALARDLLDLDVISPEVRAGGALPDPGADDPLAGVSDHDLKEQVEALETRVLQAALARQGGNITRTAAALGLSRLGLRKKMRRYRIVRGPESA